MTKSRYKVFISHSMKDMAIVDELREALAARGLQSWTPATLEADSSWVERIDAELKAASVFLLIVSPDFLASHSALFEAGLAYSRAREGQAFVLPVLVRDAEIPSFLRDFQFLDARQRPAAQVAQDIAAAVSHYTSNP